MHPCDEVSAVGREGQVLALVAVTMETWGRALGEGRGISTVSR